MKVLIADKFEDSGVRGLEAAGCEVVLRPELDGETLTAAIRETQAEILIVRSTKVTEVMFDVGRVALVVRAGAGYNTIDVAAASRRGVYVSNCPGRNAVAVAELTLGLMLALDRRIAENVIDLRAGRWNKKEYSKAAGLYGRTLGLLGLGNIGAEVARRAAALGMKLCTWTHELNGVDRPLTVDEAETFGVADVIATQPIRVCPDPATVAAAADVLTVHLALVPATRGLIGAEVLGKLRPKAMFVNTSRAEVVDQAALRSAVVERGVRVGLDVFAAEPAGATGEITDPLIGLPGVYGTHHIGASTDQAQEAIAAETVRIVRAYVETGKVPNVVNLARKTAATHRLVVRHHDRPGVLAHVFEHLREEKINVQETENVVFEGALAAIARINLDGEPSARLLDSLRRGNADILDLRLVPV